MSDIKVKEVVMFPDGRLDTKNTSIYTGLSEKTLAMKRCDGTGPRFIKRGRIFYFIKALDDWMGSGEVTSTTQQKLNDN